MLTIILDFNGGVSGAVSLKSATECSVGARSIIIGDLPRTEDVGIVPMKEDDGLSLRLLVGGLIYFNLTSHGTVCFNSYLHVASKRLQ